MSKFSFVAVAGDLAAWFGRHLGADHPAAARAAAPDTSVTDLGLAVSRGLPSVANLAVNAALDFVPGGAAFDVYADDFIDAVIEGLAAKKSTGASPAQPPASLAAAAGLAVADAVAGDDAAAKAVGAEATGQVATAAVGALAGAAESEVAALTGSVAHR
jgi:hypothetical protein